MYRMLIRDNQTGEARWLTDDAPWSEDLEYLWSEGNWGCDCTRAQLFAYAGGEAPDPARTCGGTRYTVVAAALPDGTRVLIDREG
jgi:hypothetical protein